MKITNQIYSLYYLFIQKLTEYTVHINTCKLFKMRHYISNLFMLKWYLFCAFMSYQGVLFNVDISADMFPFQGDKWEHNFC